MKHRVKIIKLIHCGCDAEGEIEAEMSDSTRLFIYYQGSDKQANNKFIVGEYVELELVGSLCRAKSANEPCKQLLHVPAHSDQPFRFNPITDFGLIRSPISALSDQK